MPHRTFPTYALQQTSLTVGTATRKDHSSSNKGQVTKTATVFTSSDTPPEMTVTNAVAYLVAFDLSFQGGSHHQVDHMKLWPTVSVAKNGTVTLSVDMILNNDDTPQISDDANVTILTVIQMMPANADLSEASSAMGFYDGSTDDFPAKQQTGQCNSGAPEVQGAITGWDARSANNATKKLTNFDFYSGAVYYQTLPPAGWPRLGFDNGFNDCAHAFVNRTLDEGGNFSTHPLWSGLAADTTAPIALCPVSYRADGGTDTLKFSKTVKSAYAVVQNLSNSGDAGKAHSLSKFTCSGLTVTIGTGGHNSDDTVVNAKWEHQESKWHGAGADAWNSVVDYLIIVEFDDAKDGQRDDST